MSENTTAKKTGVDKLIDGIEKVCNKLPPPAILFCWLFLITAIIGCIFSVMGVALPSMDISPLKDFAYTESLYLRLARNAPSRSSSSSGYNSWNASLKGPDKSYKVSSTSNMIAFIIYFSFQLSYVSIISIDNNNRLFPCESFFSQTRSRSPASQWLQSRKPDMR